MFFRKFKIWFFAILAAAVLLGTNLFVSRHLDTMVRQDKLVDEGSVQGLPPVVAFTTVALGGFRGLLADILWLRVGALQQDGKYFELVQLASWITKLQPKFTGAAAYLAWNMAYNVSVTFQSFDDRWRWVNRGIELIRDEALNYNPNDPILYQQLGWIYQHKIGNTLDDAQRYYKFQIAKEMQHAYGGVPAPDWAKLDKAPKTLIEFRQLHQDPAWWKSIREIYATDDALIAAFREEGNLPEKLKNALKPEVADELETFLRALWLRDHYKMRPEMIIEINNKYGVLDWRASESFAIYWAELGNLYSPKRQSVECDRMISQSMKESFIGGRMLFPEKQPTENFILVPNLNIVDAVKASYDLAIERHPKTISFESSLNNFLIDAIVTLYSYGREKKAREYFNILKKKFRNDPRFLDFDKFVLSHWTEDMKDGTYKQAHDLLSGLIYTACLFLAYDDRDAGEAHLKLARMAYERYCITFKDMDRVKLPPFDVMKKEIVSAVIKMNPNFAPRLRGVIADDSAAKAEAKPDTSVLEHSGLFQNKASDGMFDGTEKKREDDFFRSLANPENQRR